jgi:hypothetical protein
VPAAAAATLALALAVPLFWPGPGKQVAVNYEAPPSLRGTAAPQFTVADPLRSARRAAAIVGDDARPTVWFHEGRATVDFEIDVAQVAKTQEDLRRERLGISIRPGLNRLIFLPQR